MRTFAGLSVSEFITRVLTPGDGAGVEMLFVESVPETGNPTGALPEIVLCDYSGIRQQIPRQDAWYAKNDATAPGPYEIEHKNGYPRRSDSAWAVVATPSRAVAACPMEGASRYLGTQEQAQRWADALNEKFAPQH
ncbi:hypothetical protein ACFQ7N_39360 [Streptomyces niveus]|uniref:hypothetical protein n=1 Tax=Streptomyces niveus TaxID=193462 RepID=UPI0036AE7401